MKVSAKQFLHDEDGSQSIELMFMVPLLVWSICAMLAFTEAFKIRGVAMDATAAIADTLSRQTTPIDRQDLVGLQAVAGQLTGYGDEVKLRITQLRCARRCNDPDQRVLRVIFSKGEGLASLKNADFEAGSHRDKVPMLSRGDRIILVETSFTHRPIANVGLSPQLVEINQATRMRFAPQLCWKECNVKATS
tara:strand:- start:121 stop:696 length:576 start_codon:yes stop_codon:yes gene_type:complete